MRANALALYLILLLTFFSLVSFSGSAEPALPTLSIIIQPIDEVETDPVEYMPVQTTAIIWLSNFPLGATVNVNATAEYWEVIVTPSIFKVPQGASEYNETVSIDLSVPPKASAERDVELSVFATATNPIGFEFYDEAITNVSVKQYYGLSLSPNDSVTVNPEEYIDHTIVLTNTGNGIDNYTVVLTNQDTIASWGLEVYYTESLNELGRAGIKMVGIFIDVSTYAEIGSVNAIFRVISEGDSSKTMDYTLSITVQGDSYDPIDGQITNNRINDIFPDIYRNYITWKYYGLTRGINLYNIETEETSTIYIDGSCSAPKIFGDMIVWIEYTDDGDFINGYNITTKENLKLHQIYGNSTSPDIYGRNIVWGEERNDNYDIYLFNIDSQIETRITTSTYAQGDPCIYGNNIVYVESGRYGLDIKLFNLENQTEMIICDDWDDQYSPDIFENYIVWCDERDLFSTNVDIYMYDLERNEELLITNANSNQRDPRIHNDYIVWADYRLYNKEDIVIVSLYDILTKEEQQITTESKIRFPVIYDNIIVWEDSIRDPHYLLREEIIMTEIEVRETLTAFFETSFDINLDGYQFSNYNIAQYILKTDDELVDEGFCFGIAETSLLYYEGKLDRPSEQPTTYSISMDEARWPIDLHQYRFRNIWGFHQMLSDDINLQEEYMKIRDSLALGKPIITCVGETTYEKGHAMVAYELIEYPNYAYVSFYDSNWGFKTDSVHNNYPHVLRIDFSDYQFDYNFYTEDGSTIQSNKFISMEAKSLTHEIILEFLDEIQNPSIPGNIVILACPADSIVDTDNGQVIGFIQNDIVNTIPNAHALVENDIELYYIPSNINFSVRVIGNDNGNYNLYIINRESDSIVRCDDIPISKTSAHDYTFNWLKISRNEDGVTLYIDNDGDDIIDHTLVLGDSITQDDINLVLGDDSDNNINNSIFLIGSGIVIFLIVIVIVFRFKK
jgi:beta propeller repeat protein